MRMSEVPAALGDSAAPAGTMSRGRLALAAVVLVVVTFAVRAPMFRVPLDQDGSVFCYCAMTWAEGGLPYRDAWDHKSPLIFLTYRALFAVAPPSCVSVNTTLRVGSGLCDVLTAVLLFLLARRFFGAGVGMVAALLFVVFTGAAPLQLEALQPERLTVLFTAAGVLAAAQYVDSQKLRHAALSGLLFGVALIAKQIAAPVGVAVWAWVTWEAFRSEGREALKRVVAHSVLMAAGAALPYGLCAAYFAARGAFADFWECTYTFNVVYAGEHRKGSLINGVRRVVERMGFDHAFLWATAAGGMVVALARRAVRSAGLLLGLWAVAVFGALILPGQFANYYYVPTVAPLAVASAVGLAGLWRFAWGPGRRVLRLAAVGPVALVLLAMVALAAKRAYWPGGLYGRVTGPRNTNVVVAKVAEHLKSATKPGDRLYMWGGRPQIYVLSGRRNVCRYLYNFHYHLPRERAFHYQQGKLEEILGALREHTPPYIVATDDFDRFPELGRYIAEHYELEREWTAESYPPRVYRRKGKL